jgi:hypothetical protein
MAPDSLTGNHHCDAPEGCRWVSTDDLKVGDVLLYDPMPGTWDEVTDVRALGEFTHRVYVTRRFANGRSLLTSFDAGPFGVTKVIRAEGTVDARN